LCAANNTKFEDDSNDAQMKFIRALAVLGIIVSISEVASAAEWQYCLAPSNNEHKIYFSGAFATNAGPGSADSSFERALVLARLSHDEVQCPRADDENSVIQMIQDAVKYNQP
jgi:hypothetical protein